MKFFWNLVSHLTTGIMTIMMMHFLVFVPQRDMIDSLINQVNVCTTFIKTGK